METKYAYLKNGQCVEVIKERGQYVPVDRRIRNENGSNPEWTESDVFNTPQSDKKIKKTGTKIALTLKSQFVIRCDILKTRSVLDQNYPIYTDRDTLAEAIRYDRSIEQKAIVTDVRGYEGNHFCGYCEGYSAEDPKEDEVCAGCGHSSWNVWENRPEFKIGDVLESQLD